MTIAAAQLEDEGVIVMLLSLALLLGMAKLLGEMCRRWGQPQVVGELLAGLEVELTSAWRQGKAAGLVAIAGMGLPFTIAFVIAWSAAPWFGPPEAPRLAVALFIGIALSITALPVIAKILIDLNMIKSDIGMVVMSAAMLNDLIGWLAFAVVMAIVSAGDGSADMSQVGRVLLYTLIFMAVAMTVLRWAFHRAMPWIQAHLSWPGGVLGVILVLCLLCAAATEWIGIHAIFGAFIAGVLIGDSHHLRQRTRDTVHEFIANAFAPIFFAGVGLHVNIWADFHVGLVLLCLLIAVGGKLAGSFLGATWSGMQKREGLAVGFGMVAQGTMGLILGRLALQLNLITEAMFVAIMTVAILTSLISGPAMRKMVQTATRRSLGTVLTDGHFIAALAGQNVRDVIGELASRAAELTGLPADMIDQAVWQRERIMRTGLGNGLAVPHARLNGLDEPVVVIGLSSRGVDFDAPDGRGAKIICLLLTPAADQTQQLELLNMVARAFATEPARAAAVGSKNFTQLLAALKLGEHSVEAH